MKVKLYSVEKLIKIFEIEDSEYIKALNNLGNHTALLDQCDFDRNEFDLLLKDPVNLVKNIEQCVTLNLNVSETRDKLLRVSV